MRFRFGLLLLAGLVSTAALAPATARAAWSYGGLKTYCLRLTSVQFSPFAESLKGTEVEWTGIVLEVKRRWFSSRVNVELDMDLPYYSSFALQDVYLDVTPEMGALVSKGQALHFRGRIEMITNALGFFSVTLTDVWFLPEVTEGRKRK